MLVPETPVFTHVLVMLPEDHPVVRPTLFTVTPAARHPPSADVQSSEVMVNEPTMSRLPLFAPLVRAIRPSPWLAPSMYAAREASLTRHFRPLGQPGPFLL